VTTLLVGGTGFLGTVVAQRLVDAPLRVLARPTSHRSLLPERIEVFTGDLDDFSSMRRALAGMTRVVYCASMGFGHVPPLVDLLREAGVRRAVFVSTTAIYTTLPAQSRSVRVEAERAVQHSDLEWTILRPTMIYGGARDRNISRLLHYLRRWPVYPIFGDGRALHQPIYVDDLADALVRALDAPAARGRAYNLAGAAPLPYVDLVRTAARAVGRRVQLLHVPLATVVAAARLWSRLPLPTPVSPEQVLRLAEDKAFDWSEAGRDFGFAPRSFHEGVALEVRALGLA
jgi:nucleoside-diphosphate-sugar epimerase